MNEVHAMLSRVKELAVQAASDTYVLEDREAINDEFEQLKEEIDRISETTEYNTMRIFDDGSYDIEFNNDICPMKIFNSKHGTPDDPNGYGGIIIGDDVRVSWDMIDPDMVTKDPDTGETIFRAGEYKYETVEYDFTIVCEDGAKPPEIKVEFEVHAGSRGINVAGTLVLWEDIVDANGNSILMREGQGGTYYLKNGLGSFTVEAGAMLADVIDGLNTHNEKVNKRFYNIYDDYYVAQAVDVVDAGTRVQLT